MPTRRLLALTALLPLLTASCQGDERFRPVYPARGQVFFNGKPAHGATVVLNGLEGQGNPWTRPTAGVDANGDFVLTTYRQADGAPAGKYAVTVYWTPPNSTLPLEKANKLPMRYAKPETSGLSAEVKTSDTVLPRFDLTR